MKVYKYVTYDYHPWIEKVECVKETSRYVWVKRKSCGFENVWRMAKGTRVFDSWEEAHEKLVQTAANEVSTARLRLQKAQGHLGNIQGLKPPTDGSTNG